MPPASPILTARAAPSAYLVLAGPWVGLAALLVLAQWRQPESGVWVGVLLSLTVLALIIVWLRGFLLEKSSDLLTYRSGLWRRQTVLLAEVSAFEVAWIRGARRGPTLVAVGRDGQHLLLANAKVFRQSDLARLVNPSGRPSRAG